MLAHFYAVFVADKPQNDTVFKGCFAEQNRVDGKQDVKPTACLVYRFGNEVGGEIFLK